MKWSDFVRKFRDWNQRGLKDYWFSSYVFNKWIFIFCLIVVFVVGFYIIANHDFDFSSNFYYNCPREMIFCQNPFYQDDFSSLSDVECPVDDYYFCNTPYFFGGYKYGEPMPKDIKVFPLFVLSVFGLGFVFNHIWFNKRGGLFGK